MLMGLVAFLVVMTVLLVIGACIYQSAVNTVKQIKFDRYCKQNPHYLFVDGQPVESINYTAIQQNAQYANYARGQY